MRPMGNEAWRERVRRITGAPLQAEAAPHSWFSGPCINREQGSKFRAGR